LAVPAGGGEEARARSGELPLEVDGQSVEGSAFNRGTHARLAVWDASGMLRRSTFFPMEPPRRQLPFYVIGHKNPDTDAH
jgi:hypothetical protein